MIKFLRGVRDWLIAQSVGLIAAGSEVIALGQVFGWWDWNDAQNAAVIGVFGAGLALLRGFNGPITPQALTRGVDHGHRPARP